MADPKFGSHIDPNRIGAAGHSAGGATVIELAGGVFDSDALAKFCATNAKDPGCDIPPVFKQWIADYEKIRDTDPVIQEALKHQHDPHRDPRVKAVLAMAPAVGHAFTAANLHSIHIPVYIVTGAGDDIVSAANNAQWYASQIPGAHLKIFPGSTGHFVFGSSCTTAGQKAIFICRDGSDVNREQVHQAVEQIALQFFENSFRQK